MPALTVITGPMLLVGLLAAMLLVPLLVLLASIHERQRDRPLPRPRCDRVPPEDRYQALEGQVRWP